MMSISEAHIYEVNVDALATAIVRRMMESRKLPELLSGKQVEQYLRISPVTRWRMTKTGRLRTVKVRSRVFYRREDILEFMEF